MSGLNYQAYNRFQEPDDTECYCSECERALAEDEAYDYKGWALCEECYQEQLKRDAEEETKE